METKGKLTGASRTLDGKGIILTFEVDSSASGQIENMKKVIYSGSGQQSISNKEALMPMHMHGYL